MRALFDHCTFLLALLPDNILGVVRVVLLDNRILDNQPDLIQHFSSFLQRLIGYIRHRNFSNDQLSLYIPDHAAHGDQ
ncbi:hypothetical protein D3C73_855110 [compost metagenome]